MIRIRRFRANFLVLVGIAVFAFFRPIILPVGLYGENINRSAWPTVSLGTNAPDNFINATFLRGELWPIVESGDHFDVTGIEESLNKTVLDLAVSLRTATINSSKPPAILTGTPGETVTLNLRNFVLRRYDTFTLQGTSTTNFIINVSGKFLLSNSARIVLAGGVQWNNVFFNVFGRGSVIVQTDESILHGTLTASKRTVRLEENAIVYGKVIASKVLISGAAQIVQPPIISP
jgi:Ice-binding-like